MKRIIFTGKGGVGKTTIISNLALLLARDGKMVLVIDCDPSMNLAMTLGVSMDDIVTLAEDKARIQNRMEYEAHKHLDEDDDDDEHDHVYPSQEILSDYTRKTHDNLYLMVMGTIPYGGAGCLCAPIALVKLLVNFLSLATGKYDYIIIDSQAGVEIFGRGLAAEFDLTVVITEPTLKSLEVARHGSKLATDLGVKRQIAVINKVEEKNDMELASRELGGTIDQILSMRYDDTVTQADKTGEILINFAPEAAIMHDIRLIKTCIEG